jgi:hypothetical protein
MFLRLSGKNKLFLVVEAAPTEFFYADLDFPDKHHMFFCVRKFPNLHKFARASQAIIHPALQSKKLSTPHYMQNGNLYSKLQKLIDI